MSDTNIPKIAHGLTGIEIGTTAICDIDGRNGKLRYFGMPIEKLVTLPFEHTAFLLLYGHIPAVSDLTDFGERLVRLRELPKTVVDLVERCRALSPYAALQVGLGSLEIDDADAANDVLWIGAAASIVAHHEAVRSGEKPLPPDFQLDHASDFLRRVRRTDVDATTSRAINSDFVLHADHGACASTLAVRVAASAGASLRSALQAGLSCLSGPRHGGAVAEVGELIDRLASPEEARAFVSDQLGKKTAIPGFGHRVYKVEDPRARLYRRCIRTLIDSKSRVSKIEIVDALREAMKPMGRFGLAPNDDLEAALLYRTLELPTDLNLPLFAASRISGWIAHFREAQHEEPMDTPKLLYRPPDQAHESLT